MLETQDRRPDEAERKFNSSTVEQIIADFSSRFNDPTLAKMFENCFPSTLGSLHFLPFFLLFDLFDLFDL